MDSYARRPPRSFDRNDGGYPSRGGRGRGRGNRGGRFPPVRNQPTRREVERANVPHGLIVCDNPRVMLTADEKVYKQIIVEGEGPNPLPSSVAAVNYVGRFMDGRVFDSHTDPQLPFFVPVGDMQVAAMQVCVLSMRVGEKCILTTSYEYGFGKLGCEPRIPPEATLQYEIQLYSFHRDIKVLNNGTFSGRLEAGREAKASGNFFFQKKMMRAAVRQYKLAESQFENLDVSEVMSADEQRQADELIIQANLNLAACALENRQFDYALQNCDKALCLDRNNIKGLYREALAFSGLHDFENAKQSILKAIALAPNDVTLRNEYESIKVKEQKDIHGMDGKLKGYFNGHTGSDVPLFSPDEAEAMQNSQAQFSVSESWLFA